MGVRTGDALTRWAEQHHSVAGALFGMGAALVVSVPMTIAGVPWSGVLLAAVTAGLFTGLVVGLSDRKIHRYDPDAPTRPATTLPEGFSRREKTVVFLTCMGLSVFIIVAGLVLHAKQLSYPGLAGWLILLEGTALWFW